MTNQSLSQTGPIRTNAELREYCEAEWCPCWAPQAARDRLWSIAYDRGHASGDDEIEQQYEEFVEILIAAESVLAPTPSFESTHVSMETWDWATVTHHPLGNTDD